MIPYFKSSDRAFTLLHGDCIELLKQFSFKFDMIFADPPYFLSNGGISVQSGKMVCVDKGEWDKGGTPEYIDSFNRAWISECQNKLKENGTIWISGTYHNIFSIANILTELGFKILNVVTWVKTNPPPNISCRYFTHSTEFIIWARKSAKITHYYNYSIMKQINSNKQMTDVWQLPAIARWEKSCGKHPTQKPLSVLSRIILRSASILGIPCDVDAAGEIASRSRGTPRIANALLRRVRDFAQVKGSGRIDVEIARYALEALNIDRYGLDEIDNKILCTIIDKFKGGPVGLTTIATALGEDPGTLEEVYEPFLIKEGFLKRTPRGREVTELAYKHLGRSIYNNVKTLFDD